MHSQTYGKTYDIKMQCPECGSEVGEGDLFCEYCGAKLTQTKDTQPIQPQQSQKGLDAVETAVIVCGSICLSPIISLIAWLMWRGDKPRKAKQASYVCMMIIVLYVLLTILYLIFIVVMTASAPGY